jgi:hypothetical protein
MAGIFPSPLAFGGTRTALMSRSRALAFVIKELEEILPPTLFFVVGFNLIVLDHAAPPR